MLLNKDIMQWTTAGKKEWSKSQQKIRQIAFTLPVKVKTTQAVLQQYLLVLQKIILAAAEMNEWYRSGIKSKLYSLAKLNKLQAEYFRDISEHSEKCLYPGSFGDPAFAKKLMGEELGTWACLLYAEFRRSNILYIQQRYTDLAALNDIFLKLTGLLAKQKSAEKLTAEFAKECRKYLMQDMEQRQQFSLFWRYSPQQTYYRDIILQADLSDPSYLYRYGVYITKHETALSKYMQTYPEAKLQELADYIIKSYKDGFERGLRSYKIKKYAFLIIPAGMERLGKLLIKGMKKMGLEAVVAQPFAHSANQQYDYDHRFSMAPYYDQKYLDKLLPSYETAVKSISDVLALHAGPVYVELFGETPFEPKDNPKAFKLNQEQLQLRRKFNAQTTQIFYKHYKQAETSFCIIAFPSPEIGKNFRRIFADTVKLNMLDSLHYASLQQKIIDVLDTAEYVHVKGKGPNKTDIMVKLHTLKDPAKETIFENCVADVNIPVGEVFTSPVLKGTNGTLHVKETYLRNLRYRNLMLTFKDGMIESYSCTNFKQAEDNRKYIEENLLMPHKTLPIGEFAIGTNTLAYQIAYKYDILHLLPILIIEKMGPHFAVGDTCYAREEDIVHRNFVNGKKIIAVENEKSALRKKDLMQAYTQVHTDITLPYDMLASISAVRKDGKRIPIIKDGFFAVPGTEELNKPLQKVKK